MPKQTNDLKKSRWSLFALLLIAVLAVAILHFRDRAPAQTEKTAAPFATQASPELKAAREQAAVGSSEPAIELLVETPDGRSVPQASIELFQEQADPAAWTLVESRRTGGDGRAELLAGAGSYLVAAHKDGVGAESKPILKVAFVPRVSLILVLRPAEQLAGRLISARREPVALGQVTLTKLTSAPNGSQPGGLQREAVADSSGRFQFAALESGDYQLEARADGFAPLVKLVTAPSHGELELLLSDAGFLQGMVEDEAGKPAAEVEVSAVGVEATGSARTSAAGAYSLQLAARDYRLIARAADGRVAVSQSAIAVRAGETTTARTLRLSAPSSLQGRVLASKDRPVPEALVTATPVGATRPLTTSLSLTTGAYTLNKLPPGRYQIAVSAGGFNSVSQQLSLAPAQHATLDFHLTAGGAISGTVRDSQGAPIANALVTAGAHEASSYRVHFVNETSTGPEGKYLLDGVAPGTTQVMAMRPGAVAGPVQLVDVPEEGLVTADFTLGDEGTLEGTVSLSSGKPLKAPAVVSVKSGGQQVGELACSPDGAYKGMLSAGDYQVRARRLGDPPGDGGRAIKISADLATHQDLTLLDDDNPDAVDLTVLDVGGAPAAGATVLITIEMGQQHIGMRKTADENGLVKLAPWDQVPVPRLEFTAVLAGRSGSVELDKPELHAQLQLVPAAGIHGTVLGVGVDTTLTVSIAPPLAGAGPVSFIGNSFELDSLAAMPVVVSVTTPDGRSGRKSVSLQPGVIAEVELELDPAASVLGRVVDVDHHPLAAYLIFDGGQTSSAGADGTFHIDNVSNGSHTLRLGLGAKYQELIKEFSVGAGTNLNLGELVLQPARAERRSGL